MTEEWKPIDGLSPYQISSLGRVRGFYGLIKPSRLPNGYRFVRIGRKGHQVNRYIHRLVAAAFIGDINGMEINHLDMDKDNNASSNLEICTRAENAHHAASAGVFRALSARLSESEVLEIRAYCTGEYSKWAKKLGVTSATICDIIKRRTWAWL